MRLPAAGLLAACVVAVMLMATSSAHAEERQFCYGANVGSEGWCSSGNWNMNSAFANSTEGRVCIHLNTGETVFSCSHQANEGIYTSRGCGNGAAAIKNPNPGSIKVYGVFWTC